MISIIDSGKLVNTDASPMVPRSVEMVGLSTDTKPTGVSVGNGWSFIEMDTGKVFFYNAEDEEWLEFAGSGGGGQGGSNVLIVHKDENNTLDKTWAEIRDADLAVIRDENSDWGEGGYGQSEIVIAVYSGDGSYSLDVADLFNGASYYTFETSSENGYPVKPSVGD